MKFIDKVLQEPSYGWCNTNGELISPSILELFSEAFSRINIFKDRKNWMSLINWLVTASMVPFFLYFVFRHFQLHLAVISVFYGVMVMAVHATVWHHRYCTHKAFSFSHPLWKTITQNLVIRTFPEEIYVISHHVHHAKSDTPGDPYNPKAGFMYCMLADVNHQSISKNLNEKDYERACRFLRHVGSPINSFSQYQKWGSVTHPLYVAGVWLLNWMFWYAAFYIAGGHGLACAIFAGAMFWFVLVRAFNYTGHGKGKAKHVEGIDFDRRNLSLNQFRPGILCGEWHNNHHLYPKSARTGFLPYQLDLAWISIYVLYKAGAISSYHDSKADFLKTHLHGREV